MLYFQKRTQNAYFEHRKQVVLWCCDITETEFWKPPRIEKFILARH